MKKLIAVLLFTLLVLSLVACGSNAAPDSTASETGKVESETTESVIAEDEETAGDVETSKGKIGMLVPTLQAELFAYIDNGCKEFFNEKGYEFSCVSFDDDMSKAIEIIENFTTSDVDLILGIMSDQSADGALMEARDKGIKVGLIGSGTEGTYDILMTTDHAELGRQIGNLGADFINEQLGGTAQIAFLSSDANADNIARSEAVVATIEEQCSDSEIVATANVLGVGAGTDALENILQQYPDVKVVLTINDQYAIEAAEVLSAAGKTGDDYCVIGADGSQQGYKMISEGTVFRGTAAMGDVVDQITTGAMGVLDETLETPAVTYVEINKITKENVADFL